MLRVMSIVALAAGLLTMGCGGINQRAYYRDAIAKFHGGSEGRIPDSKETCWLAADLVGNSAGSNTIAEEEFTHFLIKKDLCKIVEKHPDATVGYTWPQTDVCPCPANVQSCQAQCDAKPDAAAGASPVSGFGLGGGGSKSTAPEGHDNNRSNDKLLERFKKSTLPDKLITYRIDELNKERAVIHFRVSNVKKKGEIEESEVIFVYPKPAGGEEAD